MRWLTPLHCSGSSTRASCLARTFPLAVACSEFLLTHHPPLHSFILYLIIHYPWLYLSFKTKTKHKKRKEKKEKIRGQGSFSLYSWPPTSSLLLHRIHRRSLLTLWQSQTAPATVQADCSLSLSLSLSLAHSGHKPFLLPRRPTTTLGHKPFLLPRRPTTTLAVTNRSCFHTGRPPLLFSQLSRPTAPKFQTNIPCRN